MVRRDTDTLEEYTGTLEAQQETLTKPLSSYPDLNMSHFDIEYWAGLGAHRVPDAKDSTNREKETCVSGEVEIMYDREDRPQSNIEIGGDALASEKKEEGESISRRVTMPSAANTMGNGLIGLGTMLSEANTKKADNSTGASYYYYYFIYPKITSQSSRL